MKWKWSKANQEPLKKSKREMKQEICNELNTSLDESYDYMEENKKMYGRYTRNDKVDTYKTQFNSGRDWVAQTNTNPYLQGNDYINDLENEDMFLRPRNSNNTEKYLKVQSKNSI